MHQQTGGMLMLLVACNVREKASKTGVRYYRGLEGYDQCRTTGEIGRQLQDRIEKSDTFLRHFGDNSIPMSDTLEVHLILGQTRAHTHQCWASLSTLPSSSGFHASPISPDMCLIRKMMGDTKREKRKRKRKRRMFLLVNFDLKVLPFKKTSREGVEGQDMMSVATNSTNAANRYYPRDAFQVG